MGNGLFSYSDKGRDRPEPERAFARFWYRYAGRLFHLMRLNLLFFLITLPFYVWTMTMYNGFIVGKGLEGISLLPALITYYLGSVPPAILIALVVVSALCWGPAWAGLTFVSMRYSQGKHAWVWADFRDAFRENFKQALPTGIIEAVIVLVTFYYLMESVTLFGEIGGIAKLLWGILILIYVSCRMYLFPMMVSVELPLMQLIKNSLLLAFIKPLRTLLGFAVILILTVLSTFADMVILPLFAYSFFAFATSSVTMPVLKKYVLKDTEDDGGDAGKK